MSDPLRNPEGCLEAEAIAALVDGRLEPPARARAQRHLASCEDCYAVFIDVVRGVDAGGVAAEEGDRGRPSFRRYVLAGGGLAAAAGLVLSLALPGLFGGPSSRRPELGPLVEAVGPARPVDARLTGGFAWGVLDNTVRAGAGVRPPAEVTIAAGRLQQAVERDRSPAALAAFGTSRLVLGETDAAIAALEEATAAEPRRAEYWSDLAGAYLAQSAETGNGAALPRALDAAEAALAIDPALPEALFNRAAVLEALRLVPQAREAWTAYLAADAPSGWTDEARRRLERLAAEPGAPGAPPAGRIPDVEPLRERLFAVELRGWIDAAPDAAGAHAALAAMRRTAAEIETLAPDPMSRDLVAALERASANAAARAAAAAAHDSFLRAEAASSADRFDEAMAALAGARPALARMGSPLAYSALYIEGVVAYRRGATREARDRFTRLRAGVVARGYVPLAGRVESMLGLLAAVQGERRVADEHYRAALAAFAEAGDPGNHAAVSSSLASNLDGQGDPWTGWALRVDALQHAPRPGVLLSASLAASRRGWLRAGLVFAEAGLQSARAAGSIPNMADALRTEASIRARLDDAASVTPLLAEARALVAGRDDLSSDRLRAEIALAEAQAADAVGLDEAIRAAGHAMEYFTRTSWDGRLPEIHAIRARLHRRAGRTDRASSDIHDGLAVLARQRAQLAPGANRATFEAVERELVNQLVALAPAGSDAEDAFAAVDASRGRDVVDDEHAALTLGDLRARLPARTVFVEYVVSDESSYAWVVTAGRHSFHRIPAGRRRLADLVRAVTPPRDEAGAIAALARLLLEPIEARSEPGDTLVIVPDGPLRALPFARLPLESGSPVIGSRALLIAPSAAGWLQSTDRARRTGHRPATLLAVGNPALDRGAHPGLRDLPHADAEALAVAERYPAAPVVLRGADATRDDIIRALATSDVVHFAGHAVIVPWVTDASFLPLAGPASSRLTAADVRTLDLGRQRLVVLAACETASGGQATLDSPLSLSRAFLAAGATNVIGSLWVAGDRASRTLFEKFHAAYARTGNAAESLRQAQAALAGSDDPTLAAPRQWAGFVVMGGSPPDTF